MQVILADIAYVPTLNLDFTLETLKQVLPYHCFVYDIKHKKPRLICRGRRVSVKDDGLVCHFALSTLRISNLIPPSRSVAAENKNNNPAQTVTLAKH